MSYLRFLVLLLLGLLRIKVHTVPGPAVARLLQYTEYCTTSAISDLSLFIVTRRFLAISVLLWLLS